MSEDKIYLSHSLNNDTPTFGNRTRVAVSKLKSKAEGSTVNESMINLPLHSGTHIDFPYHFFNDGTKHERFDPEFWFFKKTLLVEIEQNELIIETQLIDKLDMVDFKEEYDLLLVKTGATDYRNEPKYWERSFGLSPDVATYLRNNFKQIRAVGMDFISLSSYQHSNIGKEAHLEFLKPESPILIVEDMDFSKVNTNTHFNEVVLLPLRIDGADGSPVTCIANIQID